MSNYTHEVSDMLKECFEGITDGRQASKVRHNLLEIVLMTICAIIAGCDAWEDIADFCRVKESWLRERLGLKLENGIPSHDTFSRVWSMIEPEELNRRFKQWVGTISEATEQEIVSIDGKTLRRSGSDEQKPLHMISAWASKQQLVLGQTATDAKSNEITAVPELLDMLDVAGCIVTADAMSCQKTIVAKIAEKQADYAIGLKDNQPMLRKATEEYFEAFLNDPKLYRDVTKIETIDKGHGRIEVRTYYLTAKIDWLDVKDAWAGLQSLGMVRSKVTCDGKETEDTRYYISSITDIKTFATAVRSHWGIENSLHWCLDMTFSEDYCRMRKDHSAENIAIVRHIALNVLKTFPANMSVARKRRRCTYDDQFLADVLLSIHA